MAQFIKTFSATNPTALVTAMNAFLATLTNPTIRGWSFDVQNLQKNIGWEFAASVSYTDGGAALATPFLLRIDQNIKLSTLEATLQAYITANAYFFSGSKLAQVDGGSGNFRTYFAATIYNTTAGASANFLPW